MDRYAGVGVRFSASPVGRAGLAAVGRAGNGGGARAPVLPAALARLRSGHLEATAVGAAEEAVEALLDQGHVDDPGRGGGAAADGGGDYHLLAGLAGADAVPLGVDERGTGHRVAAAVR